ncbi:MAG: sugar phosphate isomerase/epimerase family protein [Terriglobia bacterium]
MSTFTRREVMQLALATGAVALAPPVPASASDKGMRLGLIIHMGRDPEGALAKVHNLGIPTCQAGISEYDAEMEKKLKAGIERYGIEVTAINTAGPGPAVWDFYKGPLTIGLVPREYRAQRVEHLKRASDFAKRCAVPALHTHCGFIPENPNDPVYEETVKAIREVVSHCKGNGQLFLFETGQETPITLLRAIRDVGLDNQGINLDVANLILYGKANPVDALEVIGPLVRGMHAKDGLYPTDPHKLGEEVPIGQGKVDFPRLFARLKELNYRGPVTIEREIEGPQQTEDVRKAKEYLEKLIAA